MIALNRVALALRIITGLSIAVVVAILSWFVYTVLKSLAEANSCLDRFSG